MCIAHATTPLSLLGECVSQTAYYTVYLVDVGFYNSEAALSTAVVRAVRVGGSLGPGTRLRMYIRVD